MRVIKRIEALRSLAVDDPLHRALAARIRALSARRSIVLSHLAGRAGVSDAQLWRILACQSSPTVAWLERVAETLGVTVADLVAPPDHDGPGG
jgi:transcriptional regulator with XRE-family HTH domain